MVNGYPLPVRVSSISSNRLKLKQGNEITVSATSMNGDVVGTIQSQYNYQPIQRENDLITWEVELNIKYSSIDTSSPTIKKINHHCIMEQKD